jgi:hypothetical protein
VDTLPGRWRRVTTFVARFDPSSDWPTDVTVAVQVNAALTTWDGISIPATAVEENARQYTTPQVHIYLDTVSSAQANALTDNAWTPGIPQECPPDAIIELSFSQSVDLAMLTSAFVLATSTEGAAAVDSGGYMVAACTGRWRPDDTCVAIEITAELAVDTEYTLTLPEGTNYNPLCGSTQKDSSFSVSGLKSFAFPFTQTEISEKSYENIRPGATRLDMWLRHGLAADVTLDKLFAAMTITPAVDVRLVRPRLGTVRFEPVSDNSGFQPSTQYRVEVAADATITDGFGLPLKGSFTVFETNAETSFFKEATASLMTFPSTDTPNNWYAVAKGPGHCHANWNSDATQKCKGKKATDAFHIGAAGVRSADIPKLLAALNSWCYCFSRRVARSSLVLIVGLCCARSSGRLLD